MSRTFLLPDLGEGLTEAAIVAWHVAVGDTVAVDQVIAEVETAKSIVELPSPFAGVVVSLCGDVGDEVRVGAPFIEVGVAGGAGASGADAGGASGAGDGSGGAGESGPTTAEIATVRVPDDARELEGYRAEERAGIKEPVAASSGSGNVLIGYGTSSHGGAPQRRRARISSAVGAPEPGARNGAPAARLGGPVAVKSPLVRQLARELGVDVARVQGTGADGVVTRADVLAASSVASVASVAGVSRGSASSAPAQGAGSASLSTPAGLEVAAREPMSMLRRAVASKMSTSRAEIPEATVWVDVDVTDLWAMRAQMAAGDQPAPSLTALAARFVLMALAEYPLLASRVEGSDLVTFNGVNLGVATDTERGLMVPVVQRADAMSVGELDAALRAVSAVAREGSLAPAELTGSTITFNNYGALGVDGSAAIINHPEVAIIGMGRAIERPWVVDGAIVARRIVQVSLVFDHRVCDGGYAAGFLRHLVTSLEKPMVRFREV
ncbi:2-oxo acid dehydrogenase subunit E2 [Microbacterium mitrae]|uniref:Dihydrolipoamide acetyltransferase component of pyruvate dehydrogenase complex n=1 Tax=Microbacterium mitrae TaxID=664640 RepID=A0A5C8HMI9_9MICO|nr:dihydrolipoamide acetyltransferase family protein [Microbacterium mitrae]TXK03399.1 2-oxo acid dehydrogenase subunit E2 [Microbacterium mitrae]